MATTTTNVAVGAAGAGIEQISPILSIADLKKVLIRVERSNFRHSGRSDKVSTDQLSDSEWNGLMNLIRTKGRGNLWWGPAYHPYPMEDQYPDDGDSDHSAQLWRHERKIWFDDQAALVKMGMRHRIPRKVLSKDEWVNEIDRLNDTIRSWVIAHHRIHRATKDGDELLSMIDRVMASCTIHRHFEWANGIWIEWVSSLTATIDSRPHPSLQSDRPSPVRIDSTHDTGSDSSRVKFVEIKKSDDLLKLIQQGWSVQKLDVQTSIRQLDLRADSERGGGIFLTSKA